MKTLHNNVCCQRTNAYKISMQTQRSSENQHHLISPASQQDTFPFEMRRISTQRILLPNDSLLIKYSSFLHQPCRKLILNMSTFLLFVCSDITSGTQLLVYHYGIVQFSFILSTTANTKSIILTSHSFQNCPHGSNFFAIPKNFNF